MKRTGKQIISVSRRTDIPAFYSEWFMNRIRAGYCTVANPFNMNQISYVSLRPEDVRAFVFWTRNPKPLMKYLPELDKQGYKYYFQYTLIGYPKEIDPKSPQQSSAVKTFCELSKIVGKERIIWRYDPIFFSNITPFDWHINQVSFLAEKLHQYTNRLVISFLDPYRKTQSRMKSESGAGFSLSDGAFQSDSYREISQYIGQIGVDFSLEVQSCAEAIDLESFGIKHTKCIDDDLINRITGEVVNLKKDPSQRKPCGCVVSKDIGANDTCLFGCKYCYATKSIALAEENFRKHKKESPSLTGWHDAQPKIEDQKVQLDLFR